MHWTWLARAVTLATFLVGPFAALGAEVETRVVVRKAPITAPIVSSCRSVWKCDRFGCDWRSICPRRCPDRFTCYSLYGAYGPYGGVGFWGRYTWSGWGTYR